MRFGHSRRLRDLTIFAQNDERKTLNVFHGLEKTNARPAKQIYSAADATPNAVGAAFWPPARKAVILDVT
jgi:hypothetical protein